MSYPSLVDHGLGLLVWTVLTVVGADRVVTWLLRRRS